MRVHNSSLTFSPIGLNQKVGRNNSAQNKDENELSVAKDAQNKKFNQPSSPEEIKKTLDNVSLAIDLSGQDNIIKPTDSRTLRALSAYNQAFNAPLQDQRAQLITGIDAYA
ncbi:MAG: hypothetical protein Q7T96_06475 [Methylobacter sp.]|uniref:hypothetical protein n=1 Tax=Methylobacter sp. TaxID=2051955 RepID=UPI00271D9038|nr:hypothetical protein [Methylobacter sp.]MDO9268742.1 hypothetical protein [Methylobacter sp.]MDP1666825.1 hypothetical protein [Methylobacter sp.]MDP1970399.1 hypothetical protein [Methylobacter sp.]